jgi:hypothetical protein
VLPASVDRLLAHLPDHAVLLDVGGGVLPLNRADWVMDAVAYEDRAGFGSLGPGPERFSGATWVQRDICAREPWPFADKQLDFAVCSHTLEDVRDPIWVCGELNRVAKAGYIEVPSRLEEQTYGFQGPWTGWGHHRWLVDVGDGRIDFVFKHHVLHNRESDRFPASFREGLAPEQLVHQLWWEGSFDYGERVFMSAEELDPYLADFVSEHLAKADGSGSRRARRRSWFSR